ncbi:TetR/AcrR family transcriptional regulator [Streptomyces althioticus]|jgi:AcrR family transcriptional regulator|uniref:TetR/AcrR family transcriptional regulator n=1 Tax=Streptomyces althioticus TaxID=83380 RepID=A0ABZ1Y0T9_9ACTN|nr:TetR/AcrR family transcriptional regulator [Streptomyces althioticus]WTB96423.1 TetR/AcrR family transcriptional regulator [Streptomyces althioticus]
MTTLWDRSREVAVQAILDTAVRLFAEQGYERTTIAQIAREAGISQRSLFRYFGTKEDLVCGDQDALGDLLKRTVEQQPAEMSAWDALRTGFEVLLTANHTPDRALELSRLIFETPSLRARYLEKRLRWQAALVPAVQARLESAAGPASDPRARAIIATVFACADTATELWVEHDGRLDLKDLYDQCLAAVRNPG